MFVLVISRSSSKLGHLESETRPPGQMKGNLNILEVTCLKWSLWILLKIFVLMISRWSLELGHLWPIFHGPVTFTVQWQFFFFRLGQFLSNYLSYRGIFGTWNIWVYVSFSVTIAPTARVILSICIHLSMASWVQSSIWLWPLCHSPFDMLNCLTC